MVRSQGERRFAKNLDLLMTQVDSVLSADWRRPARLKLVYREAPTLRVGPVAPGCESHWGYIWSLDTLLLQGERDPSHDFF
jgi:hypothetical protein